MTNEPINPHDLFFKQYLSHPVAAADFLRNHLPAAVVSLVDLTRLELAKDSFVDEQLRNHFSDLVYRTNGLAMVITLLRYLGSAGVQVKKEEMAQKLLALLSKEGGVLMQTMAEEWIEEGKQIGQRATILRILERRFQAQEESLQGTAQQLAQVRDERVLLQLIDLALEVIVLPDFQTRLQRMLATSR